jgi:hypothetical protein
MSTLFLATADRKYEIFVPLYIFFALSHNKNALVEIFLSDVERFKTRNKRALGLLDSFFPNMFALTEVDFTNYSPNVVRFVYEPKLKDKCEYVYIGDIDILIMDEDVEAQHVKNMRTNQLPFSNIIRPDEVTEKKYLRLSGLHFAPISTQYPLPKLKDLDLSSKNLIRGADENILYEIMKRKNLMVPRGINFRPEHGFHLSLNRHPTGSYRNGKQKFITIENKKHIFEWSGVRDENYRNKFLNLSHSDKYQKLFFTLDFKAQNILMILGNICAGRFREYQNEMRKYVIGETYLAPKLRKKITFTVLRNLILRNL